MYPSCNKCTVFWTKTPDKAVMFYLFYREIKRKRKTMTIVRK